MAVRFQLRFLGLLLLLGLLGSECTTGGTRSQAGGGREQNGQGTCNVPARGGLRQWATGPGRHRSGSSVESSKPGPREIPSRPGPGDGHGPHWVAARRPRASQSECSPAHQAPDLPGHPDFLRVLLCFRGGWLSRGGLLRPLREIPFLSLVLTGIPLNFRVLTVQSSARKPSRNDESSSGLAAFWFLWPAGGSVAPQCRPAGFSSALRALIK